jgi:hypothetical protein
MHEAQADGASPPKPWGGAVALVTVNCLHVEQHFQNIGRAVSVTHGERTHRITQTHRDGHFEVFRTANVLLADVRSDIDDGGDDALGDESATVPDNAYRLAVSGKKGVRSIPYVSARGRIGG